MLDLSTETLAKSILKKLPKTWWLDLNPRYSLILNGMELDALSCVLNKFLEEK